MRICVFVAKVIASGACFGSNIDAERPKWYQSTEKASIFAGARHLEASWTSFWWLVEHPEAVPNAPWGPELRLPSFVFHVIDFDFCGVPFCVEL